MTARPDPGRVALRVGARLEPWQQVAAAALVGQGVVSAEATGGRPGDQGAELLIDLTFAPPPGGRDIEVWQLRFGPEGRPGPPAASELARGERFVLARLVAIEDASTGTVLVEGRIKTVPYSLDATRRRVLDLVARWPARALALRAAGLLGRGRGERCRLEPEPAPPPRGRGLTLARGALRRLAECALEEEWRLGVIEAPVADLLAGCRPPVRWQRPPARGWLADPVGVRDGTVLAEAFDPATRRGFLVRTALADDAAVEPVLQLPHHLSWPFLVEQGDELFLLPEMAAAGRIQLFRAAPFPDRFLPDAVLVEGFAGVDPTAVRHGGHWYLFATDRHDQDEVRLHLFVAADLRGPWRRHPLSPVKDDLASARPAGPLFEHAGQLFRPAQDCSRTYGGAVVIHRVERLTPELFFEVPVARLEPDRSGSCPDGLHSLVPAGPGTIVDGKREHRSARAFLANLRALLAERLGRA